MKKEPCPLFRSATRLEISTLIFGGLDGIDVMPEHEFGPIYEPVLLAEIEGTKLWAKTGTQPGDPCWLTVTTPDAPEEVTTDS